MCEKHGKSNTRLYKIWTKMKSRCYCKNERDYKNYGARSITICEEWRNSFQSFYDWAIANGYTDELTIDRIDVNGNYEPSNCRWATRITQNNNKRGNRLICYNGRTQTLAQWAKEVDIPFKLLWQRLYKLNWEAERALTTPISKKHRPKRTRGKILCSS